MKAVSVWAAAALLYSIAVSGIVGFAFTAAPTEKKNMAAAECAANDLRK